MKKITFLLLLSIMTIHAQLPQDPELMVKPHLLLIISSHEDQPEAEEQIDIVVNERKNMRLRNLQVYHVTPKRIESIFDEMPSESINFDRYKDLMDRNSNFSVILIDPDGVIKFRKQDPMNTDEIYHLMTEQENEPELAPVDTDHRD